MKKKLITLMVALIAFAVVLVAVLTGSILQTIYGIDELKLMTADTILQFIIVGSMLVMIICVFRLIYLESKKIIDQ